MVVPSTSQAVFTAPSLCAKPWNLEKARGVWEDEREKFVKNPTLREFMATPTNENPTLEHALLELEKIVQELERGQLDLKDGLQRFEHGVKLYQICRKSLEDAEKKVQLLSEGLKEEAWKE